MKLYFTLSGDNITDISDEMMSEDAEEIIINDIDDFESKVSDMSYKFDDEIIEKVSDYFQDEEAIDEAGFRIKHWVSNRSFGELVDMFKHNEIRVPEMQRKFVWDSIKSSRLIESIILGLPIPPLFLLEVDDNSYEIIDGYQRLTTLFNYMEGNPWTGRKLNGRNVTSRLSGKHVIKSIAGRSFNELSREQQTKIRRSTIPLVEFKQLSPGDFGSKYLIFERINTGSEKLNGMQIRKSLAYGPFMKSLYELANGNEEYRSVFSPTQLKNDTHVEVLMRILAFYDIVYNDFNPLRQGIKNILDEYGEKMKEQEIPIDRVTLIFSRLSELLNYFNKNEIFRRVNLERKFEGTLNIGIMESLIGVLINNSEIQLPTTFKEDYKTELGILFDSYTAEKNQNPFSISTGSVSSIKERYDIFNNIISEL